jgi:hypothetical protein
VLARKQEDFERQREAQRIASLMPLEGMVREMMLKLDQGDVVGAVEIRNKMHQAMLAKGATPEDIGKLDELIMAPLLTKTVAESTLDPTKQASRKASLSLAELYGASAAKSKEAAARERFGLGVLREKGATPEAILALGHNPLVGAREGTGGVLTEKQKLDAVIKQGDLAKALTQAMRGEGGTVVGFEGGPEVRIGGKAPLGEEAVKAAVANYNASLPKYTGMEMEYVPEEKLVRLVPVGASKKAGEAAAGKTGLEAKLAEALPELFDVKPGATSLRGMAAHDVTAAEGLPEDVVTKAQASIRSWLGAAQAGQEVRASTLVEMLVEAGVPEESARAIAAMVARIGQQAGL